MEIIEGNGLMKQVKQIQHLRSSSDSGALDNVFELLTHSGKLAPLISQNQSKKHLFYSFN